VVRGIHDADSAAFHDVARGDRSGIGLRDAQDRLIDVVGQREDERLEVGDNLVDVFGDAGDRLVLVHDAVDAEAPDGAAAQRRQQHAPHRVA
jgi:hypothetical protein